MLNTIDFDHSAKGVLFLLLDKLKECPYISELQWRQSPSKRGFHIKFQCSKNCIECRKRYDDQIRIYADLTNRKPRERNILWDKKVYMDSDKKKKTIRYAGKWHNVKI